MWAPAIAAKSERPSGTSSIQWDLNSVLMVFVPKTKCSLKSTDQAEVAEVFNSSVMETFLEVSPDGS